MEKEEEEEEENGGWGGWEVFVGTETEKEPR